MRPLTATVLILAGPLRLVRDGAIFTADMTGAAAAFARLYELLEEIELEYHELSAENRRKIILAVFALLVAERDLRQTSIPPRNVSRPRSLGG